MTHIQEQKDELGSSKQALGMSGGLELPAKVAEAFS